MYILANLGMQHPDGIQIWKRGIKLMSDMFHALQFSADGD
jgi:hypothetical protein